MVVMGNLHFIDNFWNDESSIYDFSRQQEPMERVTAKTMENLLSFTLNHFPKIHINSLIQYLIGAATTRARPFKIIYNFQFSIRKIPHDTAHTANNRILSARQNARTRPPAPNGLRKRAPSSRI
jgi:hypothetical protein